MLLRRSPSAVGRPSQPHSQTAAATAAHGVPQRVSNNTVSASPVVPSPGRFQHPRMEEIVKRKAANEFSTERVWILILNAGALLATIVLGSWIYNIFSWLENAVGHNVSHKLDPVWVINAARFVLCSNMYFALRPVIPYFKNNDNFTDIALTDPQRALLGLPPSQTETVAGDYVTPPRYRKSSPGGRVATPQSDITNRAAYSGSPMSTSRYTVGFSPTPQHGSATLTRRLSGSPFSPSSPLTSKAFNQHPSGQDFYSNQDFSESTRSLFAGNVSTNSSLQNSMRRSYSLRDRNRPTDPGTPSPSAKEKSKINLQPGLNYKWLYDKGLKLGKNGAVEYDR